MGSTDLESKVHQLCGLVQNSEDTYTRSTVLDGFVRARELSKVVTRHLRLDFDRVENLMMPYRGMANTGTEPERTLPL